MPSLRGRNGGTVRLCLAVTSLVVLAVFGLAPRGTAEDAAQAPPAPKFAGADTCIACHAQVPEAQQKDWHGSLIAHREGSQNCEECHGPSTAHTEDPGTVRTATDVTKAPADKSAAACLRCHEAKHRAADWKQKPCWWRQSYPS